MKLPTFTLLEWALGAVVIVALGLALWHFDPFGRRHRAEEKAATAEVQSTVDKAVGQITGDVAAKNDRIHRKAQEAQDALASSTDYDNDLAVWGAALDGLRGDAEGASDQPPGVPADPSGEPG